jgi:RimJ/RimL family protein N-acetyltransferase
MDPLTGELVRLRARRPADRPILATELHDDVATEAMATRQPWRPVSPDTQAPMPEPMADRAPFSVVTLADDTLAGVASLWGIDPHNRSAHIGIGLRPAYRGRGLAKDVLPILCRYGFTVLGLHRLQIDTLADNHAMLGAAEHVGFRREAVLSDAAWVMGEFLDEVVLALLEREWKR